MDTENKERLINWEFYGLMNGEGTITKNAKSNFIENDNLAIGFMRALKEHKAKYRCADAGYKALYSGDSRH